jgi:hypothetical protein
MHDIARDHLRAKRRAFALRRLEIKFGPIAPKITTTTGSGPISAPIKVLDPAVREMIDQAIAKRSRQAETI